MKRIFSLLLTFVIILCSFAGCSSADQDSSFSVPEVAPSISEMAIPQESQSEVIDPVIGIPGNPEGEGPYTIDILFSDSGIEKYPYTAESQGLKAISETVLENSTLC